MHQAAAHGTRDAGRSIGPGPERLPTAMHFLRADLCPLKQQKPRTSGTFFIAGAGFEPATFGL
jgi:hypothetical protein